jgi:pyridoxamine 5'-phosphate oxidase
MNLDDLRREYTQRGLREEDLTPDPFTQFGDWFDQVAQADIREPNAMTLATATPDGKPSARMVLLKGMDARGFTFFTNYESRKGAELTVNPQAALVFFWVQLERQVRVEGRVERLSTAESDEYFASRPEGSQLGAWASQQSAVLPDRGALEARYEERRAQYEGLEVPRPPFWGGFRLIPETVEFWQGRANRLHDRLRYRRQDDGSWMIERLSP